MSGVRGTSQEVTGLDANGMICRVNDVRGVMVMFIITVEDKWLFWRTQGSQVAGEPESQGESQENRERAGTLSVPVRKVSL